MIAAVTSPTQGITPMIGSQPKRMLVPGTRNALSSRRCHWRSVRRRASVSIPPASYGPAHQNRADGESGTNRRDQHQVALLQTPAADRVVQGEGNGGGRRVAEPLDVDDDLVEREAELLGRRQDDPPVGLVRH